jgi:hypothetical protein
MPYYIEFHSVIDQLDRHDQVTVLPIHAPYGKNYSRLYNINFLYTTLLDDEFCEVWLSLG